MKTPADLTFDDLAEIAKKASLKADAEARRAGIAVAGITRTSADNRPAPQKQTPDQAAE
jgi:hypothetical protein